jgi:hypothetical protein
MKLTCESIYWRPSSDTLSFRRRIYSRRTGLVPVNGRILELRPSAPFGLLLFRSDLGKCTGKYGSRDTSHLVPSVSQIWQRFCGRNLPGTLPLHLESLSNKRQPTVKSQWLGRALLSPEHPPSHRQNSRSGRSALLQLELADRHIPSFLGYAMLCALSQVYRFTPTTLTCSQTNQGLMRNQN